ncbi:MAG: DUF1549 domain-containing protein [Planctomycetaceae bacterium]|nr:DUF1549 domain-containing protein [Planctomycetaceae bacterium]
MFISRTHFYCLRSVIGFAVCCLCSVSLQADEATDREFFNSKVVPLLTEKCLGCHSHAARTMEGGLTLDSKAGWSVGGDRGPAIVPGKPNESLLLTAVDYEKDDLQMPPDEKLSDAEVGILREWIQRGAVDPRKVNKPEADLTDWWSLKKLVAPPVPGEGHPIDAFVRQGLKEHGISPATRADQTTLVRRLYVDLHGLPSTPEEVTSFVKDDDPQAYEHLVDRLLDSPRYGERWARHWLDVIHFADSHGCEHDVKRPHAWRYRDYVIQRFNADVPWDRFIREQLAPDVFFPEEPQLMAGLGFIAAGPLELSRAGTAPVAFDYLDRDDIVTQTMAAFVSTTANCARCHTHKFDPITQEDYYSLQAVFAGVGKGDIQFDASPEVYQRRRQLEQLLAVARDGNADLLLQSRYAELVRTWETDRQSDPVEWKVLSPDVFLSAGGATLTRQSDGSILASGHLPDQETYTVTSTVGLEKLTAIRLEVLKDERLPMHGPGRAGNGNLHLSEVELRYFSPASETPIPLKIVRASADFDQAGWTSAQAIDGDDRSGWAIHPRVNESHKIVFELADPLQMVPGGKLAISLKQLYPPKHLIGRFRLSATDAENGAAQILPEEVRQTLQKPTSERSESEAAAIAAIVLKSYAKRELESLPSQETVYGVSSSWSHAKKLPSPQSPKTVHLLRRGEFDQTVREVQPGALSALSHLPSRFDLADPMDESLRRAALADWLAHEDNPLTWRSIVNRVWHYHFGNGLCETPNDFGRMGNEPANEELLNWLAVWFRDEAKGSLKALHRLILTSQTWQQSSQAASNPVDSRNRLLWRMNRQRLDAETFRDSVLQMAGRLDLTMGGPGVEQFKKTKGPQATPTLDYVAFDWNASETHRRSIYRVVWRGIPDPFMEALDFPDLGLLAPKRGFSVSALQSLSLYNNDFVLHASQWIAERIEQERSDPGEQVKRAVQLVWLRVPTPQEQAVFVGYTRQYGLPALCRVLLNSNEFLFVD